MPVGCDLTKLDATPPDYAEDLVAALRAEGAGTVLPLSSVSGEGVTAVLRALIGIIEDAKTEENKPDEVEPWSP
ncbi:MAG: hypothetical protein ACPHQQ_05835 [Candidatus Puniceispirillum sp.]